MQNTFQLKRPDEIEALITQLTAGKEDVVLSIKDKDKEFQDVLSECKEDPSTLYSGPERCKDISKSFIVDPIRKEAKTVFGTWKATNAALTKALNVCIKKGRHQQGKDEKRIDSLMKSMQLQEAELFKRFRGGTLLEHRTNVAKNVLDVLCCKGVLAYEPSDCNTLADMFKKKPVAKHFTEIDQQLKATVRKSFASIIDDEIRTLITNCAKTLIETHTEDVDKCFLRPSTLPMTEEDDENACSEVAPKVHNFIT